jgi:hypothetical protein
MSAGAQVSDGTKPRGRPRVQTAKPLVRRNLLLNATDLARVRALYEAKSDSEAMRLALDAILLWHDMEDIAGRIAASGGPDDVYHRTAGEPSLPANFDPALVIEEDKVRLADRPKSRE